MMKRIFIVLSMLAVTLAALTVSASAACNHNWRIDYEKCVAATCTLKGKNVYNCSRCSDTKTETVPATGHDYVKISGEYATCETNSTAVEKCSVCGKENVNKTRAFGHDFVETKRVKSTCSKAGTVTYKCETCRTTKTESLPTAEHDFSEFISTSATCTTGGKTTYQCSMCSELSLKSVSKLGHDYETTGGPTCTESGKYTYTCKRCKYSYDSGVKAELGHDLTEDRDEWKVYKKATCTEEGQIRDKCSRCKQYIYESIEMIPHEYGEDLFVTKVPTATEAGICVKKCENCDYSVEKTIKMGLTDLTDYLVPPVATTTPIGEVARGTKVTLTCQLPDTKIYYAIEGDPFDVNNRIEYTEPLSIFETTVINVCAVYVGDPEIILPPSTAETLTYILDEDSPWVYFKEGASEGGYMPIKVGQDFRPNAKATRYEVIEALDNLFLSWAEDAEATFTDVDSAHVAVVNKFVGAKLLNGYDDSTFRGNANIKRSELCKVLALALGLAPDANSAPVFPDVPVTHWAYAYIAVLTEAGYLAGDTDGNFRPEDNLTRAELAVVLNRIAEVESSTGVDIPDVDEGHWAYGYICSAVAKNK